MGLPQTFSDQESLESVGKKDNHVKSPHAEFKC